LGNGSTSQPRHLDIYIFIYLVTFDNDTYLLLLNPH